MVKQKFLFITLIVFGIASCAPKPIVISVGTNYQGGIIAYVDSTGEHGLIVNTLHYNPCDWGCFSLSGGLTGADSASIGSGSQNTIDIIAGCPTAGIAARYCDDFTSGGYSDWYLPSKDELNLVYMNHDVLQVLPGYHWSSTEINGAVAWCQDLTSGSIMSGAKSANYNVCPVRSF